MEIKNEPKIAEAAHMLEKIINALEQQEAFILLLKI